MSFSKIFYIDPCSQTNISCDGKSFSHNVSLEQNAFIASRVFYDDVISHSFKVAKETSEEEIKSAIELKMYEDVGLDLQKEYKMTHIIKELEFEDMVLVEAFSVEKSSLEKRFATVLQKSKYIDFLAIPFLSFATLYKNKIIAPKNDVFVYIGQDEAFLTIYKDGKYLSTKSLPTLKDMVHTLHKHDIDMDVEKLEELFITKGLDANSYTPEDAEVFTTLEAVFSEVFTKINNLIIHSRSVFGFDKVDRLFFSTQQGRIKGLRDISNNFFSSELKLFDFNLFKEKVKSDFFSQIVASYAYDVAQESEIKQDITFFKREAPFLQTQVGKFSLFVALVLILVSVYPLYLSYDIANLETKSTQVTQELNVIKNSTKKLRNEIKIATQNLSEANEQLKLQNQRVQSISKSIEELYSMKVAQRGVSDFLQSINKLLKKYNLATKSITLSDVNHMSIEVFSTQPKRDTIAKFMNDLISEGFVEVNTKEIKLDNETYISVVEISR